MSNFGEIMTKNFQIKEVKPKIFHLLFKDRVKMCLSLIRFAEFFESPFKEIKNKKFSLVKYIEIYIKKTKNSNLHFTYPGDWSGFNFPSDVFFEAVKVNNDLNEYETEVLKAINELKKKEDEFYIIASSSQDSVLKHEIAHGFWYINQEYKNEMKNLLKTLTKNEKKLFFKKLKSIGYCNEVIEDETQAYLSTGLSERLINIVDKKIELKFKKVFKKYYL